MNSNSAQYGAPRQASGTLASLRVDFFMSDDQRKFILHCTGGVIGGVFLVSNLFTFKF